MSCFNKETAYQREIFIIIKLILINNSLKKINLLFSVLFLRMNLKAFIKILMKINIWQGTVSNDGTLTFKFFNIKTFIFLFFYAISSAIFIWKYLVPRVNNETNWTFEDMTIALDVLIIYGTGFSLINIFGLKHLGKFLHVKIIPSII